MTFVRRYGEDRESRIRARALILLVMSGACATWSDGGAPGPTSPAELCPDGPGDAFANEPPSRQARRCLQTNAPGEGATHLRGRVVRGDGLLGTAVPGAQVELYAATAAGTSVPEGPPLAKGSTDAQGAFHISAFLSPRTYVLIARSVDGSLLPGRLSVSVGRFAREPLQSLELRVRSH